MIFTANQVRPIFLGQAPVAGRIFAGAYLDSATIRAPWLTLPEAMAMQHPQFQRDVDAFASDLRNTGNLAYYRADSIARVAVREADGSEGRSIGKDRLVYFNSAQGDRA